MHAQHERYINKMIRKFKNTDIDQVINIWLKASIAAHDFIDKSFWQSKINDMKYVYLPAAETYIYEENNIIKGFLSLQKNILAALFVSPDFQGAGIGTELIKKAQSIRNNLNLTVYKENIKSIAFYKKNGFEIEKEQIDPHTGHLELVMNQKEYI